MDKEEDGPLGLETLPYDGLAAIVRHLSLWDVSSLMGVSKALRLAFRDERMWYLICDQTWSGVTDIRLWVVSSRTPSPSKASLSANPASYRELFHLLRHIEPLCGVWRVIGGDLNGTCVTFAWKKNALEGRTVEVDDLESAPRRPLFVSMRPGRGNEIQVEWIGDGNKTAVLRVGSGDEAGMHRSPSAEAAAAVSFGTPQSALGTSPEGSFEYAWREFMSSKVAKSSKARRRLERSGRFSQMHHLRRVGVPKPSWHHPLAGFWAGDCGDQGFEVLRVRYDFKGPSAMIICDEVTGGGQGSGGFQLWSALAKPLPQPLSQSEQGLYDGLHQLLEEEEDGEALDGLAAIFEQDGGNGNAPGETEPHPVTDSRKEVASIHKGQVWSCHVFPETENSESEEEGEKEGRLWVYTDGSMRFWWLSSSRAPLGSVPLRRIDI